MHTRLAIPQKKERRSQGREILRKFHGDDASSQEKQAGSRNSEMQLGRTGKCTVHYCNRAPAYDQIRGGQAANFHAPLKCLPLRYFEIPTVFRCFIEIMLEEGG